MLFVVFILKPSQCFLNGKLKVVAVDSCFSQLLTAVVGLAGILIIFLLKGAKSGVYKPCF